MANVATNLGGASAASLAKVKLPGAAAHEKRYPIAILIDRSGSTGEAWKGNPSDNEVINTALPEIFKVFRDAPRTSPLGKFKNVIDIMVLSYSDDVKEVLPWTPAEQLPKSVQPIESSLGTSTGHALNKTMEELRSYQQKHRATKTPIALANLIHITDGAPTDMQPNDTTWNELQAKISKNAGSKGVESKRSLAIVHFVTPNGCDPTFPPNALSTVNGITHGLDRLAKFTGADSVKPLTKGMKSVDDLVKLVTGTVIGTTVNGKPLDKAAGDAVSAVKKDKGVP